VLEELEDGGTQIVWTGSGEQHCHHYTLGACVMLEVAPGRTEPQPLHRENAIYQPYVGDLPVPEFIVSTMWTGTDYTTENGATRLVPGSHLFRYRTPDHRLPLER
jgi:ectoine hydroxylase-related dioxygenase (phytanoyl-CoA dioxygenase family)